MRKILVWIGISIMFSGCTQLDKIEARFDEQRCTIYFLKSVQVSQIEFDQDGDGTELIPKKGDKYLLDSLSICDIDSSLYSLTNTMKLNPNRPLLITLIIKKHEPSIKKDILSPYRYYFKKGITGLGNKAIVFNEVRG